MTKQGKYDDEFETNNFESKKLIAAFNQATDIRKFEIELYWKRAGYFWALIAVTFAGYFAILSSEHIPNKFFLSFVVANIGLVFTFAWHLGNRGSKYWQENWENHLELLEDKVTGPLYKTLLERPRSSATPISEKFITSPLDISVSRINQWTSVFVLFVWMLLMIYSLYNTTARFALTKSEWLLIGAHLIVLIVALGVCYMMLSQSKTYKGKHCPNIIKRDTEIND